MAFSVSYVHAVYITFMTTYKGWVFINSYLSDRVYSYSPYTINLLIDKRIESSKSKRLFSAWFLKFFSIKGVPNFISSPVFELRPSISSCMFIISLCTPGNNTCSYPYILLGSFILDIKSTRLVEEIKKNLGKVSLLVSKYPSRLRSISYRPIVI